MLAGIGLPVRYAMSGTDLGRPAASGLELGALAIMASKLLEAYVAELAASREVEEEEEEEGEGEDLASAKRKEQAQGVAAEREERKGREALEEGSARESSEYSAMVGCQNAMHAAPESDDPSSTALHDPEPSGLVLADRYSAPATLHKDYLLQLDPGYNLCSVVWLGVDALERARRYEESVWVLRVVLSTPFYRQKRGR
eukprot:3908273-Rhodomonas_salina.1